MWWFADAAFTADEDPTQRLLVEDALQRGLHGVEVVAVQQRSGTHVVWVGSVEQSNGRVTDTWVVAGGTSRGVAG